MITKRIVALLMTAIFMFLFMFTAYADGTDSFTHWDTVNGGKKAVYSKDVYKTDTIISARSLGIETDIIINDITGDNIGNLYILTDSGQILIINSEYKLVKSLEITESDGSVLEFSEAKGIYVTDNNIFIGDTSNGRVLVCDINGKLINKIGSPNSPVLPKDFNFLPTKIAQDSKGFLYVISEGAYYGALLFDKEYEFLSFYGANTVNASVLSTIKKLWDMLTKNDKKRGNEMKKLPFQFLDIALDRDDFAYTCTGVASGDKVGQIRMLSPGGSNILDKNYGTNVVAATSFNFAEADIAQRRGQSVEQSFIGIDVDDMGYIYALDSMYGIIYVYDTECNLITAFGGGKGSGDRAGTYMGAASIEATSGKVYVADNILNNITVYEKTDYGKRVLNAQSLTLDGSYIEAKPLWQEISKEDNNNRLAIAGLAKAAYSEDEYKKAMVYAKDSLDRVTYDQAMKKIQEQFISDNFALVFITIVIVLAAIVALIMVSLKKRIVFIKNERLRIAFTCCMHPFKNFGDIKYKNMGSVGFALIFTMLFFISAVVNYVYTDFRFTSFDAATYNPFFQLATTVGLVILWSASNWAVSVLKEGKGKYKQIFVVTGYAVLPLILYNFISTLLSHVITSSSQVFLSGLYIVAVILTGIILIIGTMVIEEFSFPKFIITALLTLFAMILIIFIIFMICMLLSQLWQFVTSIAMEVIYR